MEDQDKHEIGRRVLLERDLEGTVVFSSRSNEYSDRFTKKEWPPERYAGILIEQDNGALIFIEVAKIESGEVSIQFLN